MDYIQLTCKITSENIELVREILTQQLADVGFESFEETTDGVKAYIPDKDYSDALLSALPSDVMGIGKVEYVKSVIKDQNWNAEWEKNFQPVLIADKCYIRAPFHAQMPSIPYEIVMEPKMAFGTGHHETTSLMIELMLTLDFSEKQVLDMGCGTGVLAIMASMLKAKHILAIDIDEWAFRSTIENSTMNGILNITAKQGDIDLISDKRFDVVLANINRNILLHQITYYSVALVPTGLLLMSGIYQNDLAIIRQTTEDNGFRYKLTIEKNNWIAILFEKM